MLLIRSVLENLLDPDLLTWKKLIGAVRRKITTGKFHPERRELDLNLPPKPSSLERLFAEIQKEPSTPVSRLLASNKFNDGLACLSCAGTLLMGESMLELKSESFRQKGLSLILGALSEDPLIAWRPDCSEVAVGQRELGWILEGLKAPVPEIWINASIALKRWQDVFYLEAPKLIIDSVGCKDEFGKISFGEVSSWNGLSSAPKECVCGLYDEFLSDAEVNWLGTLAGCSGQKISGSFLDQLIHSGDFRLNRGVLAYLNRSARALLGKLPPDKETVINYKKTADFIKAYLSEMPTQFARIDAGALDEYQRDHQGLLNFLSERMNKGGLKYGLSGEDVVFPSSPSLN